MILNLRAWFDQIKPMPTGLGMVIIAGMPKSGTTAIARLLGATTGQVVCSDPFHKLDTMHIKFRDALFGGQLSLETLWRRNQDVFSGAIIKDPNFPLLLPQIRALLPEARLVSIVRDPRENIRSILNRLGLPGNPRHVDLDTINIPSTWRNVLSGKRPLVPGDNYVEVLAWRWRMSAEALLEYRNECAEIRYEEFNKNKSVAITELARQLGYSKLFNIAHLVDVQYQPKGDVTVRLDDFFGEAQIEVIDRVTGPILREFGYASFTTSS